MSSTMCPLCNVYEYGSDQGFIDRYGTNTVVEYHRDQRRLYWQCAVCSLVFVEPNQRLNAVEEKAEYDKHQNAVDDMGYRKFLARLCDPLTERLAAGAKGLDFGCGPGPALSAMLAEQGFDMNNYDIFYADEQALLQSHYDFITATEVAEHLFEPGRVINQLWAMLNKNGVLGLMTKLVIDKKAFSTWHYKNDLTHVCFFSVETFQYLAQQLHAELSIVGQDVILLKKRE